MTPKEKALELIEKFKPFAWEEGITRSQEAESVKDNAKQCVIICVDEIIRTINEFEEKRKIEFGFDKFKYWIEVKKELEKI